MARLRRPTLYPLSYRRASRAGHLEDVARLCRAVGATGKLVADSQHAALAIAEGCTWVSPDADFGAFEPHGLRWQHLALE